MCTLKPNRWVLFAVLFTVSVAIPRNLPAQETDQSPAPAAAPPAAQAAAPAPAQPTAEQLGDSLTARQRYQAAIAAYSKAPQMTADDLEQDGHRLPDDVQLQGRHPLLQGIAQARSRATLRF